MTITNPIETKDKSFLWFGFSPIQRVNAGFPITSGEMIAHLHVSPAKFYEWKKEWQRTGRVPDTIPTADYVRTKEDFQRMPEPDEEFDTIGYLKRQGLAVAKSFVSMLVSGKATPKSFEIYYQLVGDITRDGKVLSNKEKGLNAADLAKVVKQHSANQRTEAERVDEVQGQPEVFHPELLPAAGQSPEDDDAVPAVEVSGGTGGLDICPDNACIVHPEGTTTGDIVGVLCDSPAPSTVL